MRWIHQLAAAVEEPAGVLGGKGHGLVQLLRLGLPVPAGFVIGTPAGRAFRRDRRFPDGLTRDLAAAIAELEAGTGRHFGGPGRPLVVSVRSGAGVSMPGMMTTILNLGLTAESTAGLAAETGDPGFADDCRRRLLAGFPPADRGLSAHQQLELAVAEVFSSWDSARARTYRALHDVPDDLGTAVTVQAMVFGNRDRHSGTGVAFSRNPNTGEPVPFGEVLFGGQGEDVVSGRSLAEPLAALADREPAAWADLLAALHRIEEHYRDACSVEFTVESGVLWILQVRAGGLTGRAAVRVAVELADAGVIDRAEACRRVPSRMLPDPNASQIETTGTTDLFTRGLGACPGAAVGAVATTADAAVRMSADGPVILVRPHTSPSDLHGLAAAAGVLTATGGPTSHAAVVARAMGKPAVVGATGLTVDTAAAQVRASGRTLTEGTLISIDGTSGEVAVGAARIVAGGPDPYLLRLLTWAAVEPSP